MSFSFKGVLCRLFAAFCSFEFACKWVSLSTYKGTICRLYKWILLYLFLFHICNVNLCYALHIYKHVWLLELVALQITC
jgi:hypothetical protein